MQILVSTGNGTASRIALSVDDPLATEAIFRLNGLQDENGLKKVVKVAAFNAIGTGPYSGPVQIEASSHLIDPTLYYYEGSQNAQNSAQYTWLIALLGKFPI